MKINFILFYCKFFRTQNIGLTCLNGFGTQFNLNLSTLTVILQPKPNILSKISYKMRKKIKKKKMEKVLEKKDFCCVFIKFYFHIYS